MREDFLAELLRRPELGPSVVLLGLAVAFVLGAFHALSPGHGKTLVAAYLVGSRGTMRHAALLGASVTVTHTFSVFLIGITTLFVSSYVVPEKIIPVLGVISGLSIVAIGGWLFAKRYRTLRHAHHHRHHHHDHDHHHEHHHHHHHEGGHAHSHVPQSDVTMGSLIALGASGGLVPCPSAMVLMLSAIALGRTGLGLVLLIAFSLGLAGVLVAIGGLVLYAKHWLPEPEKTSRAGFFRLVPVLSAAVIVCIGMLMTGVSLGWVRVGGLIG
jgi:ABC-type nickel/cobalt efflux system permease component RcnA